MGYILEKSQLKFSSLTETNDPIEIVKKEMTFRRYTESGLINKDKFENTTIKLKWSIMNTKIACFCRDTKYNQKKDELAFNKGYLRPRMWAQYADDQKGICIVFDKSKLLQQCLRTKDNDRDYNFQLKKGPIDYTNGVIRLQRIFDISDADLELTERQFFQKKEKYLFRTKFLDFQDEHEFRIIFIPHKNQKKDNTEICQDIYVDITDTITGIICGYKFNSIYNDIILGYAEKFRIDAYQLNYKNGYPGFYRIVAK